MRGRKGTASNTKRYFPLIKESTWLSNWFRLLTGDTHLWKEAQPKWGINIGGEIIKLPKDEHKSWEELKSLNAVLFWEWLQIPLSNFQP